MSDKPNKTPQLTPLADALPSSVPFVAPEMIERETGIKFRARLGANESTFGPSPQVHLAIQDACADVFKYPDPQWTALKTALSSLHAIPPENIVIGEGIDGLLSLLCRLMIEQGDVVVTSLGAYPTFNFHVTGFGGRLETVPYNGDYEDPDALIAKARDTGAKLVYIANPDNPMGTHHNADVIQHMIDNLPDGCLLILDEAYIELAPENTAPPLDITAKNVIRFRTFSKAYGLAGLRVGYGIAHHDLVKSFDKIRNHFGMSGISQRAALAAVNDQTYLSEIQSAVAKGRERIAQIATENGLKSIPSATNFVAIDCGQDGDFARRVLAALADMGVFIRMPYIAPHDRCIRISVGVPDDIELFATAFPRALEIAQHHGMSGND
jgi:histidinol-phosphate aminotransferase